MPLNTVIFNSVSQFVEQVGRRIVSKWGELDQLTCIYNGPASGAIAFRPKVNSTHPNYPLMFVTDSGIRYIGSQVAEVEVTYTGILQTSGAKVYRTPPILSITPVQGSRDFEVQWYQEVSSQTIESAGQVVRYPQWVYGTQKENVRYVGSQVSIKYNMYPAKAVDFETPYYSDLGFSKVEWEILNTFFGEVTYVGSWTGPSFNIYTIMPHIPPTAPPIRQAYLGMSINQKGLWYEITENYGPTF